MSTLPAAAALDCRLPSPPLWIDRPPSARAAERRARKAYFAALDALHLGSVSDDAVGKLQRLVLDVRSVTARQGLEHLLRVFGFVRRKSMGRPVLVPTPIPLATVRIGVPAEQWLADRAQLAQRFAWPLEWLVQRRYVVGKALLIDWYPLPARSEPAMAPSRPTHPIAGRRLSDAA